MCATPREGCVTSERSAGVLAHSRICERQARCDIAGENEHASSMHRQHAEANLHAALPRFESGS
eukprot:6177812-Pleurochrysis_carterae.AAC.2